MNDATPTNDQPTQEYTYPIVSPSALDRQVNLGLGLIRDAANDRATREISEGGVRRAVDVHDAVLLDAAIQLLAQTPYTVVGGEGDADA